ncbi:hypothetical protein H257_16055 [Aphanomyces astaci]|uniref:Uncharacterized protein n=1 Tax=Aphanomyces astaci TaxID=112090 RepID=W4FM87_APHAT|nr:hypothetical protein H257_16055 [Aphanomyces astaci]ETV67818.1 hypothetical protein H257_16055 [Aphanomyces astaci]|eukprot:XP_009842676.1 hypothetical protein H257_16055 [Aphanomyces astaci]
MSEEVVLRKSDGLFYCPRCIVHYVNERTFRAHCKTKHGLKVTLFKKKSIDEKKAKARQRKQQQKAAREALHPMAGKTFRLKQRALFTFAVARVRGAYQAANSIVKIDDSTVPSAGRGLFANVDLSAGDICTVYDGEKVYEEPTDHDDTPIDPLLDYFMANAGGSPCEVDVIRTPNPSQAIPTLLRHILWPDTGEAAAPLSPPLHPLADLVENVWEAPREVDVLRTPSLSHAIPAHLRHILRPYTGEAAAPLSPLLHLLADLVENAEGGSLECDVTGTSSYTWSTLAKQQLFPSYAFDNLVATLGTTQGGGHGNLTGSSRHVTSSPSDALASLVDYTVDGMWEFDVTGTWGDGAYDTPDFTSEGSNVVDTANDNTGDEIDHDGDEMGDDVILVADFITGPQMSSQARQHEWILVGEFDTYNSARDCVAPSTTHSTRKSRCTVCQGPGVHEMCARYLTCFCREHCLKHLKLLCCSVNGRTLAFKRGQYGDCSAPSTSSATLAIRSQADRLFAEGITPSRVRHRLKDSVPASAMPNLKWFQNRARYYRMRNLHEHSKPVEMARMLATSWFDPRCDETTFFSFGFDLVHGVPQIGYGGASGVFKVGITTKALLRCMHRDPSSFVFHWDATYKINALAYPVLICGITDPSGKFHPVAFFLIGRESADEYEWAMKQLMPCTKPS